MGLKSVNTKTNKQKQKRVKTPHLLRSYLRPVHVLKSRNETWLGTGTRLGKVTVSVTEGETPNVKETTTWIQPFQIWEDSVGA